MGRETEDPEDQSEEELPVQDVPEDDEGTDDGFSFEEDGPEEPD